MANKLDQVEFSHVNTITKEAGFSGFRLMSKLRDRTSHADFLFILIKVNSSSKDQFNFIASALKRLFSQLDPLYESGLLTLQYGAGFVARE